MSDVMISAKAVVDFIPCGFQYLHEFTNDKLDLNENLHFRQSLGRIYEEICIYGRFIVWSERSEIYDSFPKLVLQFDSPIIDAFRTLFYLPKLHSYNNFIPHTGDDIPGRLQEGLSVFELERMTFVDHQGEKYVIRLPCRLSSAWALETAILLERQPNADEMNQPNLYSFNGCSNTLFTMFSLTHPLDEAAPVIMKVPLPDDGFAIGFVTDINLKIIAVIKSLGLVLTYHERTKLHSLWKLEIALPKDYASLYQIDVDGRASVAPHALSKLVYQACDNGVNQYTHLNAASNECSGFILHGNNQSQVHIPCLSPFETSLSRITNRKLKIPIKNKSLMDNNQSSLGPNKSLLINAPMTPTNLEEHINRFSNFTPIRNISASNTPTGANNFVKSNLRRSFFTTPKAANLTVLSPKVCILNAALTKSFSCTHSSSVLEPSKPMDSAVAGHLFDSETIEELLDEPLMPKVCLRLIWTEPASSQSSFNVSSVLNRRFLDVPIPLSNSASKFDSKQTNTVIKNESTSSKLAEDTEKFEPSKTKAFLATDMTFAHWICYLTRLSSVDSKPNRLVCLSVKNVQKLKIENDSNLTDVFGEVVYLKACDAGYLSHSRITVCLEPGTGIVLYSGIVKICLLGLSPTPMLSISSSICGPSFTKLRLQNGLYNDFSLPFVIRPNIPDLDSWRQNEANLTLNKCVELVISCLAHKDRLMDTLLESVLNMECVQLEKMHEDLLFARPMLTNKMDHSNKTRCLDNGELFFSDFVDDGFTLGRSSCINSDISRLSLLMVHLPHITENELVYRCLSSLNQTLPPKISLALFTQWYLISNAPGVSNTTTSSQSDTEQSGDIRDTTDGERLSFRFGGTVEWARFAKFILSSIGLSLTAIDLETHQWSADNDLDATIFHYSKRQRPAAHDPSDSDWTTLSKLFDSFDFSDSAKPDCQMINACSLFPVHTNVDNLALLDQIVEFDKANCCTKQIEYSLNTHANSECQLIAKYLPSIFLCFHLVFEESKLNTVMASNLKHLGELNIILARLLGLSTYICYYEIECPDLINFQLIPASNVTFLSAISSQLEWPDRFPTDHPPCLLMWITQRLQLPLTSQVDFQPYIYMSGVNDLATAVVGMVISALCTEMLSKWIGDTWNGKHLTLFLLEFWDEHLTLWNGDSNDFNEQRNLAGEIDLQRKFGKFLNTDELDDVELKSKFCRASPYTLAFVETVLDSVFLSTHEGMHSTDSNNPSLPNSPHHFALLFLSRLEAQSPSHQSGLLSQRLRTLPSGLSMLLQIFLSRCRLQPPPNCDPHVYNLMGRNDLAKQATMFIDDLRDDKPSLNSGSLSKITSLLTTKSNQVNSSWSAAERWTNLVQPWTDSTSNRWVMENWSGSPHAILYHLENNPACQVSFKDDLRLREAYRMLQSFSHIRLPRVISEDASNASSSNVSGWARITESRLEMHLAAAGVRVWASIIGRGMFSLGILMGSRIPTRLRVPPICLRGRTISSTTGRCVFVDLARESLNAATNNTANMVDTNNHHHHTTNNRPNDGAPLEMNDRRLVSNGQNATSSVEFSDASTHPGNSLALAIASAVSLSGAGASLRTASFGLQRMIPSTKGLNHYANCNLSTLASNAASSTVSLLSSASLQQSPAVLAAKHWPDFHNGVAVGLSISPHASVDATWIMYNCRAAGISSLGDHRSSNCKSAINSDAKGSSDHLPTPEQAGLIFGLGLNGHLNKITPFGIGEYLVRVHDLHNMAVLLGLCAGKRGTMDQSVLRLIAVHYRPLLPSDPLINIQLTVPNLCQSAAIFGLGLLYQGSAHRHVTNLLMTELGRALGESANGSEAHGNSASLKGGDNDGGTNSGPSVTNQQATNSSGWSGAGGTGGFSGESCELMALSAGLALGLVLLGRGDSPCGLSDLHWAEKLHAYMTSGLRNSSNPISTAHKSSFGLHSSKETWLDLNESCLTNTRLHFNHDLSNRRDDVDLHRRPDLNQTDAGAGRLATDLRSTGPLSHHITRSTGGLFLNDDDDFLLDTMIDPESRSFHVDSESRLGGSQRAHNRQQSSSTYATNRFDQVSSLINYVSGPGVDQSSSVGVKNPQICDIPCYNTDVSAPGAIIALSMAYLGTDSTTISSWLAPLPSLRQFELTRPDLFMYRAMGHGLVNWNSIEPTIDWILAYFPDLLWKRLVAHLKPPSFAKPPIPSPSLHEVSDLRNTLAPTIDLSSEDDVENRCPESMPIFTNELASTSPIRSHQNTSRASRRGQRCRPSVCRLTSTEVPRVGSTEAKVAQFGEDSLNKFGIHDSDPVDLEAISLAYLNVLVGRCFAIGLRFAGTSNAAAADLLYKFVQDILNDDWWPLDNSESPNTNFSIRSILTGTTIAEAAAKCLLCLSMILAGSGNLTVLRLARQLRAIHLFASKSDTGGSVTLASSISGPDRFYAVTRAASKASAQTQLMSTGGSTTASNLNGPVSVASVFGVSLASGFGLQMLYASAIGLLFLGGGRLTLSNTPESAAILTIAFFPLLPTYAGDNWYHLQALRHLYVLATIPRRICAVDVDTGRVVLSDLRARLQNSDLILTSKDTFIFPSGIIDQVKWVEINHNSDKYWPTVFHNGTTNWKLFKLSYLQSGYIFVKKRNEDDEIIVLRSWLNECLKRWLDVRVLQQLKLLIAFLRRFPLSNHRLRQHSSDQNDQDDQSTSHSKINQKMAGVELSRWLAVCVNQKFLNCKPELSHILRCYYMGDDTVLSSRRNALLKAARVWFNLPDSHILAPQLSKDSSFSLKEFLVRTRPLCPMTPVPNLLILHKFLF